MGNLKSEMRNALKGFTIIELMISTAILGILIIAGASIYTNFYNSVKNLQASNKVYEEARFTMERIAREIRNGTVDYEEYYNQTANFGGSDQSINNTYGQNYCQYSRQFYGPGPDGQYGTYDDESLGVRKAGSPAPIPSIIQDKLFLINSSGDQRTYIKKITGLDGAGKVGLLKLIGKDYGLDHINGDTPNCLPDSGERDGLIDTWLCDKGFNCTHKPAGTPPCNSTYDVISDDPAHPETSSFLDITPSTLDIEELKFFISPMDDPYKAYNDPTVQLQPNITIKLTARASKEIAGEFKGKVADIVLESTVSSRTYNEIITACNLQECIGGSTRDCPKKPCKIDPISGACINYNVAQVTCAQGVWPICTDEIYTKNILDNGWGNPGGVFASLAPLYALNPINTYYEADNEVGACNSTNFPNPNDITLCKKARCEDGFDNDGNGLADGKDPACVFVLCNNGVWDPPTEDCLDVGGSCYFRPKEDVETNCSDGYDNDCNYKVDSSGKWVPGTGADEFDSNCVKAICSDGQKSVGPFPPRNSLSLFLRPDYPQKNYLLNATIADQDPTLSEQCTDIGGLCSQEKSIDVSIPGNPAQLKDLSKAKQASETGDFCYDGLDNDCSGKADELDPSCKNTICSNGVQDLFLAPADHTPADYLVGYLTISNNDEQCTDKGGVCGPTVAENTFELCTNGEDDDCNNKIDGTAASIMSGTADTNCCADNDGDTFFPTKSGAGGPMCAPPDAAVFPPNGLIDCNDLDSSIHPGAPEVCDDAVYQAGPLVPPSLVGQQIDNNCSGLNQATNGNADHSDPACCIDDDNDGYGKSDPVLKDTYLYNADPIKCHHNSGLTSDTPDCNDSDPNIYPGAAEICDGKDNNCDGKIDENPLTGVIPWTQSCYTGPPATRGIGECRDGTQTCSGSWGTCVGEVLPAPTETCDGLDNNCNGATDEGVLSTFYKDNDGDGFGDSVNSTQACSQPAGYVTDNTDCNDSDPLIHTGCP